jgi:XTP/dITP diphosphohydrolase
MDKPLWKLNTANPGKCKEYQALFAKQGVSLETTHIDLKEIDADHLTVTVQKASQLDEHVLIEDTTLDIEGAEVGIHVRWLLDHLPTYAGKRAVWSVLLAYREGDQVYLYKGSISGTIVPPRGTHGFGFDPVFLPDGAQETLAEAKPDSVNARAQAVSALLENRVWQTRPAITNWSGPWQNQ